MNGIVKKLFIIILTTFFFYVVIISIESYFFKNENKRVIQEEYMEKSYDQENFSADVLKSTPQERKISATILEKERKKIQEKELVKQKLVAYQKEAQKKVSKYIISYFPAELKDITLSYSDTTTSVLDASFLNMIEYLSIEMYQKLIDVRGKMKDGRVLLYGVLDMELPEFTSVFIHEFGHYLDLYYLEQDYVSDDSNYFYDISWNSTKVIKKGQSQDDFVSGYAMSNKYEDFAESFTYYTLHNESFITKAKKSTALASKYDFFSQYLYKKKDFQKTNFSTSTNIKDYYRDITKINIDTTKFLQYIKK